MHLIEERSTRRDTAIVYETIVSFRPTFNVNSRELINIHFRLSSTSAILFWENIIYPIIYISLKRVQ